MIKNLATRMQREADQALLSMTVEQQTELNEFDRMQKNRDRSWTRHRDGSDFMLSEEVFEARDSWFQISANCKKPGHDMSLAFLNEIYSQSPEDFGCLMINEDLMKAIESLTLKQKKVLFFLYVKGYDTTATAAITQTTVRNVRKHRQKALDAIRRRCGIPNAEP